MLKKFLNNQNVNAVDDETGRTPLAYAAKYDLNDIVDILLSNGADVNIADKGKSFVVVSLFFVRY